MQRASSRALTGLAIVLVLCAGAAAALALAAAPAHAFSAWSHDGIVGCSCHNYGAPTDATCTSCHAGFQSVPGYNCWSCHRPGASTAGLSSPSSACSQTCHLYSASTQDYTTAFTHGTNPHLGATPDCLGCHSTSPGIADPGQSPHHTAAQQGFANCGVCHTGFAQHAGSVACTTCHPTASAFHLYQATTPGFTDCTSCHSMKHQGEKVPLSKCATCHKGTGTGGGAQAQHSATVTRDKVCGSCHNKQLHATKLGSGITSCGKCHTGKYHAKQKLPGKSVCQSCHHMAKRHTNGYQCTLCHASQVHKVRPKLPKIRG
jgi:hypothetical protein